MRGPPRTNCDDDNNDNDNDDDDDDPLSTGDISQAQARCSVL